MVCPFWTKLNIKAKETRFTQIRVSKKYLTKEDKRKEKVECNKKTNKKTEQSDLTENWT